MEVTVSKDFIKEFNQLKLEIGGANVYAVMQEVYVESGKYHVLYDYIFNKNNAKASINQTTFAKIWTREIKLTEQKELYLVWVKGSELEDGFADFMYFGDEEDDDNNAIDIDYNNRFNTVKENYNYLFSKEKAFKLRDTGYFEIERIDD